MQAKITTVKQGRSFVWAIQLPHTVLFTCDGSLESAQKKLSEIQKKNASVDLKFADDKYTIKA